MKLLILFILTFALYTSSNGQPKEVVDRNIYKIKSIPSYYLNGFAYNAKNKGQDLIKDSAYFHIRSLDTSALSYLIPYLSDTTLTTIKIECHKSKLKIADVAFFLINDIEPIPFALVTGSQWCICCECGSLPEGFLSYINTERLQFKNEYVNFFYGDKRKQRLKTYHQNPAKKKKKSS